MAGAILVLVEHIKEEILGITYELLAAGRLLGKALGLPVCAVVAGASARGLAAALATTDPVVVIEGAEADSPDPFPRARILKTVMDQKQASLVLIGATNLSIGVGAKLSALTGLPFVNFCKGLRSVDGDIIATSQLFGGKILADIRVPGGRGIICVQPGGFAAVEKGGATPVVEALTAPATAPRVTFNGLLETARGDVDITKQDVLVAIGRGIQRQENIQLAEELATLMGGAVCASRPVVDQGWLPLTRQVGKSGMTVKPKLYLALGISGAPEHLEGMKSAQTIIAVNMDFGAPIFEVAHYGVCADLFDILPPLIEKTRAAKEAM
jgi:electron transfer flavoprotein alpha subunit